jgi:hypothetical protein
MAGDRRDLMRRRAGFGQARQGAQRNLGDLLCGAQRQLSLQ